MTPKKQNKNHTRLQDGLFLPFKLLTKLAGPLMSRWGLEQYRDRVDEMGETERLDDMLCLPEEGEGGES